MREEKISVEFSPEVGVRPFGDGAKVFLPRDKESFSSFELSRKATQALYRQLGAVLLGTEGT